jgi:hypothetical protein
VWCGGTEWRSWFKGLRYKSVGRGFDYSTMALGSTQPLTEYFLGRKASRCVVLTILPPYVPTVLKFWSLNHLEPSGSVKGCTGIALSLIFCWTSLVTLNVTSSIRCVLCEVRSEVLHSSDHLRPLIGSVTGASPRRVGFDPSSAKETFVVNKWSWHRFFTE